jgi:hypothetical protein
MTNGRHSVTGGFWALPQAVQTTNAPTLMIAPAGPAQAHISWSPNTPGFGLQERADFSSGSWANAPRRDQSRHRPGHAAGQVLPPFQTLKPQILFQPKQTLA